MAESEPTKTRKSPSGTSLRHLLLLPRRSIAPPFSKGIDKISVVWYFRIIPATGTTARSNSVAFLQISALIGHLRSCTTPPIIAPKGRGNEQKSNNLRLFCPRALLNFQVGGEGGSGGEGEWGEVGLARGFEIILFIRFSNKITK